MEEKKSIFRRESLDRVESPEKLDKLIKASSPSAWIFAAALLILTVSVVVWGFTGTLPRVYNTKGIAVNSNLVYCFIPPDDLSSSFLHKSVNITLPDRSSVNGKVTRISTVPLSSNEMSELLGKDWLTYQFVQDDYGTYLYRVDVRTNWPLQQDTIVSASIITDSVNPIVFLLN